MKTTCWSSPKREEPDWLPHEKCLLSVEDAADESAVALDDDEGEDAVEDGVEAEVVVIVVDAEDDEIALEEVFR